MGSNSGHISRQSENEIRRRLLDGPGPVDQAWRCFLACYSRFILHVARQFDEDHDALMEKYVHVCQRLAEEDFRIIRSYEEGSPESGQSARFTTWLMVVVRNLCVEEYRSHAGRKRYPRAVSKGSDLLRRVFALYYWDGYSLEEIDRLLGADNRVDDAALRAAIEEVMLFEHTSGRVSRKRPWPRATTDVADLPMRDPAFRRIDNRQSVDILFNQLDEEQKLVVRLKYWSGMTATEIGRCLDMPARRVYTVLDTAERRMKKVDTPEEVLGNPSRRWP